MALAVSHTGNEADVTVVDFLVLCEHDAETQAICLYIEGLRDGRRFLDVARRITRTNLLWSSRPVSPRMAVGRGFPAHRGPGRLCDDVS